MKYIDAGKLIAALERQNADKKIIEPVIHIITSLHQEQPKVDLVVELRHHLATTPREQLEKEWKELEPYGNIGPTVREILYGKQPEVDLEKEYSEFVEQDPVYSRLANGIVAKAIARHFYELGKNSK